MFRATRNQVITARDDVTYDVTGFGKAGVAMKKTKLTWDVGGCNFHVLRVGTFGYRLLCADTVVTTARKTPILYKYPIGHNGTESKLKAGIWGRTFSFFQNGRRTGAITPGPRSSFLEGIVGDFRDDLPHGVQIFLLLLAIQIWSQPAD